MSTETLHLICVVEVKPEELTRTRRLSHLPELLDRAITAVSPALNPEKFFLVEGRYAELVSAVNKMSVNYHKFTVERRGDPCELGGCEDHCPMAEVIPLVRGG